MIVYAIFNQSIDRDTGLICEVKKLKVTFCGHADVWGEASLREWLTKTVEQLIERGADLFYLGGYGGFDGIVHIAVINSQYTVRSRASLS